MQIDAGRVNLSERDIENYLFSNPTDVYMDGWCVYEWVKRQYKVPSGIIDLVGMTTHGCLVVVEVKNVEVDARAITQVCRYTFDIMQILENVEVDTDERNESNEFEPTIGVIKLIIGPSIGDTALRECEACKVRFLQFKISMSMQISGLSWTDEYKERRGKEYKQLAQDPELEAALYECAKGIQVEDNATVDVPF